MTSLGPHAVSPNGTGNGNMLVDGIVGGDGLTAGGAWANEMKSEFLPGNEPTPPPQPQSLTVEEGLG